MRCQIKYYWMYEAYSFQRTLEASVIHMPQSYFTQRMRKHVYLSITTHQSCVEGCSRGITEHVGKAGKVVREYVRQREAYDQSWKTAWFREQICRTSQHLLQSVSCTMHLNTERGRERERKSILSVAAVVSKASTVIEALPPYPAILTCTVLWLVQIDQPVA